jgi:uncharacterized membrane protein YjjB (DUF3815 family)
MRPWLVLLAVMAVGLVLAWIIPALFGVSAEVVIVVAALAVGLLGAGVVLLRGRRREGGSA